MTERFISKVVLVCFILLWVGLFYTQIIRYPYYSRLSRNNSIRILPIDGPRGDIFDRNGTVLVTNRLSFDAALIYRELRDRRALAQLLNSVLHMNGEEIAGVMDKAARKPYAPVTIAEDIDKEKAISIEEAASDIDGLMIETRSRRSYLYNKVGSHLFGYLGEITESELGGLKEYGYRMKDLMGRAGIEKYYDSYLRGVDGGTQIEVDSLGRQTRIIGIKEPASGRDLYLTVDVAIQKTCDTLLGEHKGAIVAMDPRNGQILALASHPAFDPNVFIRPGTSKERRMLLRDRVGRPLSDKAISALYAPGSIFKIVTASAALEKKKISPQTRFFCPGSYRLGRGTFDCWKEGGHGSQNLREGLMNSCNVFFYNTGRAAGVDNIEIFAKLFGFGRPTGIDLPDEVKGVVPGRAWKRSHLHDNWYEGETINYSIGQGYLLVTPIQVAEMMSVVANRGNLVRPFIVKRIGSDDMPVTRPKPVGISSETIRLVRAGLFDVVNAENGTGKRAAVEGMVVAGKTGTAQNPQGKTHAWFAGFAPYDDPKICLVVFLEHGGKGGLEPASIARGIFEEAKSRGYV